jgi:hypothetical protein
MDNFKNYASYIKRISFETYREYCPVGLVAYR